MTSPFSDSIVFSVHTRKQRFQKVSFSNRSTLESVFECLRFRRCSVDDSRIRSKTAPFSFENGLVCTEALVSRTMLLHKRLYISLSSSAKQQREMMNSALSEERELRRLIFLKFYFKFVAVSQIQFRDSFDSDTQT